MSYPLRLPENLDREARERAEGIGISFNAFICVCVDAYLHGATTAARAAPAGKERRPAKPARKPEPAAPAGQVMPWDEPEYKRLVLGQRPDGRPLDAGELAELDAEVDAFERGVDAQFDMAKEEEYASDLRSPRKRKEGGLHGQEQA